MVTECAEIGVLYNDADIYGVRFHKVPRSLFDLIPGEDKAITAAQRPFWTKRMTLAGVPGNHVELTMYCNEPPLSESEPSDDAGNIRDAAARTRQEHSHG